MACVMPYGRRAGLVPRRPEDFGDGGAFPEVRVAQYPLSMGLHKAGAGSHVLPVTVDARGRVAFDAVVRQGENSAKVVYTASPHDDANDAEDEETVRDRERPNLRRASRERPASQQRGPNNKFRQVQAGTAVVGVQLGCRGAGRAGGAGAGGPGPGRRSTGPGGTRARPALHRLLPCCSRRRARDKDRDVGEKITLGTASGTGGSGEIAFDERLFNQDRGMDSGFAADDQYNVYSGRLFAAQPTLSTLYRPNKHGDCDTYGGNDADEQLEKITETSRFKPDRGFSGDRDRAAGKRERPVEFDVPEESREASDPFVELDQYIDRMMEGKRH